ncbi:MAG: hypothetical protein ACLFR0_00355 [Alphaproteobacteria bacterium]
MSDDQLEQKVNDILDKRAAKRHEARTQALVSTFGIVGSAFAAAWIGGTVMAYIPFPENQTVTVSSFNEAANKITLEGGSEWKMKDNSVDGPGVYECDVSRPLASSVFPLSGTVPDFLKGVSGCELTQ